MSVETAESILSDWIDSYSDNKFYQWAIVFKENGYEPIGTISVVHMNEEIHMVHIGYCIGRRWWHKGITSEAFKGIIPFK
jgi:[ribosomal protein S5]-alanine N-acetyltransferase